MHGDVSTKVSALASYLVSGVLISFGDVLQFLDTHAGAVGCLAALGTMGINWYYTRRGGCRNNGQSK